MKMSRVDIFVLASEAIQNKEFEKANKLLDIINRSIQSDKDKRTYSKEIELTREEAKIISKRYIE